MRLISGKKDWKHVSMQKVVTLNTCCFKVLAACMKFQLPHITRSSAIAEGPRDALCQLKSCQLPRNSAETIYTTSPDQIDGMKLAI